MRTRISQMFNIAAPIFAFSHCRDVVVGVSKAGGLGVLGATRFSPKELGIELSWIDDHIGGRPYGVDADTSPIYQSCWARDPETARNRA